MSYKFEAGKDLIIEAVIEKILEKMQPEQAKNCAEFARQFYSRVAIDDLLETEVDDLYGAIVNFWTLIEHRAPDEAKIRIYNPDLERDGWQTSHTVVEIICKDMPFLVDSVRMVINRLGYSSYLIIHMGGLHLIRNENNQIVSVLPKNGDLPENAQIDAPIFLEIDRQTDPVIIEEIRQQLERVLIDNRAVVEDWSSMRQQINAISDELGKMSTILNSEEVAETCALLQWIEDHHFTFLGVRDYQLITNGNETLLQPLPETGLGILRPSISVPTTRNINTMTPEARQLTLSSRILVMSKTNTLATVHRNAYTDYIGVKRFNEQGDVVGERRIIGLYTSAAYNTSPRHIPFLRHKVALIMNNSGLNPRSHAGKILLNILETFPRDDLIQATEDELLEMSMGIYYMQERRKIRLFGRVDIYRRFISCLVYVPRDRFNTELRQQMQAILSESFNAQEITFSTYFSESVLARIHFIVRIDPQDTAEYNFKNVEKKLIDVGRSWTDDLQQYLYESFGEESANFLYNKYKNSFPAVYTTNFTPRIGVLDIKHIEQLSHENPLGINFYRPVYDTSDKFKLKIYQHDTTLPLSDVLPIIENLGLRAVNERPYVLRFAGDKITWVNDFFLLYSHGNDFNFDEIRELFQNAFAKVWFGEAENDGFNKLVLSAGLDWRQVSVLRTYSRYFRQIGFTLSQRYIETALNHNAALARKLVNLFELYFNPQTIAEREKKIADYVASIFVDLDNVDNLDEDKIIRLFVQAISATLRTNYYQLDEHGHYKPYISIKLDSKLITGVPRPHPMFEIFVYSPRFEGVHLRGGKVARGGIRWSDRREDFRTEILGLMKAQQVKNAVIVPTGAKGGFVAKRLPSNGTREDIQAEGIGCYQQFIRGLLDITDNYKNNKIVKPANIVCYDEDDPYLVVAADKGTATFSDIANQISLEYDFWLGDAFASGGSIGYDHKKMGITARGAWESVKHHFYEMGINIQQTDFTVVGIGDMAGDVFGNGMLLSEHIKLVAAFNHMHIFIDPNPSSAESFKERQRLFNNPRLTWADYNKDLISTGGGVFNRNAKSIVVSSEMQQLFDIEHSVIEPNELIKAILSAKVDLLWSAGIGTFVKADSETNADVGDRSNDAIRINANQLRCKVVGEGGNLGFTQLARAEYAVNSGLIYTDFIDNSAGVSCSDKEVNIKILLNTIVSAGDLTEKQRNQLLTEMTDEVAQLVLRENYLQTGAISLMASQSARSVELHSRYMNELERMSKLDRALEYLPDEKALTERKLMGQGLACPEIAVLFCYSKIILKEAILASDVPEDPYLKRYLLASFPKPLQDQFSAQMQQHPLKREIIATKLSNIIVNEMGFTFIYRMQDETGAPVSAIARAYIIVRDIFGIEDIRHQVELLDNKISAETQTELMMIYVRLLRRVVRWFLRSQRTRLDITKSIKRYAHSIIELKKAIPVVYGEVNHQEYDKLIQYYQTLGIDNALAHELTCTNGLFAAMDIIEVAHDLSVDVTKVAKAYFGIGEHLDLSWIREQIIIHPTDNHWEALSREALRDDLDWQQRQLTAGIIQHDHQQVDFDSLYATWSENHAALIERWHHVLSNLRSSGVLNYTMFFVAIRELLDLTQTTIQVSENRESLA
ncbi:MAG: NAD-glutamate dehydrogenase [Legionella sp.]